MLTRLSTPTPLKNFGLYAKRGIVSTIYKISKNFLQLYIELRYNNRMSLDIFGAAIRVCQSCAGSY